MATIKKWADKLSTSFVSRMAKQLVPWGPLGYVTYKRTYSRLREDLGRTEEYHETVERCVNAVLEYGGRFTKEEAEQLYEYIFQLKCSPPGRMFWQLGTPTVARIGGASCCNCFYVNVSDLESFCFTFDMLMLGGGVGFGISPSDVFTLPKVLGPVKVVRRDGSDVDFIVPDNREGWVELLRRVLHAYFITGRSFSYSVHCVRGKGERIKGFGGIASGPGELVKGISQICGVLDLRSGKKIRPVDALDIMNIIGSVVVSGNVRRSAQIAVGSPKDVDYLQAKMWSRGTVPNWRNNSNNTVRVDEMSELGESFWDGYTVDEKGDAKGENYGLFNLALSRSHGRLIDGPGYRPDEKVDGPNPCVPGSTRILTRDGYERIDGLVGKSVEVWNGEKWSAVEPRVTGHNQPLVTVKLSDGTELTCTTYHEWCVNDGGYTNPTEKRVKAKDLSVGDKLAKFKLPVVNAGVAFELAYSHGFFCGDGHTVNGKPKAFLYGKKQLLSAAIGGRDASVCKGDRTHVHLPEGMPPKFEVPLWADVNSRLNWLAGLLDSDGCVVKNPNGVCLQVSSIDIGFLQEVRLLLTTLGVSAKIGKMNPPGMKMMPDGRGGQKEYYCQQSYRLLVGSMDAYRLLQMGLNCLRLDIPNTEPQRDAKRFVTVVEVMEAGAADTVYCFTEPLANRGTFEGIVTGQCAEQSLEDGECCDLYELYLKRLKTREEFVTAARLGYKVCKTVLQLPFSWSKTQSVVTRNQRMGIGVSGFCEAGHFDKDDYTSAYRAVEELDVDYSREIKANKSIKLTTVKPSGTVSLLPGVTPGVHPAFSRYYIRRIRFSADDPIVGACRSNGYHVEPKVEFDGSLDHGTQIVNFPVDVGPDTLTASQVSAVQQMDMQKFLQTYWSDNAVSVTVYYRDEELPAIREKLNAEYKDGVKTISFSKHTGHGFKQAPYEEIGRHQFDELNAKCKPIKSLNDAQQWDIVDSLECAGGACPVK